MKKEIGEIIFKQGDIGDYALLIEKGQVELYHLNKNQQEVKLTVLGEGELLGETALFDSNLRTFNAKALTACEFVVIKKDRLFEKVNTSDKMVQLIVRILLRRLKEVQDTAKATESDKLTDAKKIKFETDVNLAFFNKEFRIYHQPIVNLETGKTVGSEALIRWDNPTLGIVSPVDFVESLESSSMIVPVGYWILEECFKQHAIIAQKANNKDFTICINLSVRQLMHHKFTETLSALSEKYKINPKNFKLETNEKVLAEGALVFEVLKNCQKMGFLISLDDFGTGFASLQYLSLMPINVIKIERSFIKNISKVPRIAAMVDSIIYMAKRMNITIIAQGIETEGECRLLVGMGCKHGQGYLFSKPVDFQSFLNML